MTDVLEIMAKAHWEHPEGPNPWVSLSENMQASEIACMRAALLALAEAELPDRAKLKGGHSLGAFVPGTDEQVIAAHAFRSICRSLAEGE